MAGSASDPEAQKIADQLNRKRGRDHFSKTWQSKVKLGSSEDTEVLSKEMIAERNLQMGRLLQAREAKYWSAENAATLTAQELQVRNNGGAMDAEASDGFTSLTNKPKKVVASQQRSETLQMIRSDQEGNNLRRLEVYMAGMVPIQSSNDPPKPMFQNGASIIQWWASWMQTTTQPFKAYKEKGRPAWYKGEIVQHVGHKSVFYAGVQHEPSHVYQVNWQQGQAEIVPECFMQPRLAWHKHYAGKLTPETQEEAPHFWTHHNEGSGANLVYRPGQLVQSSRSSASASSGQAT